MHDYKQGVQTRPVVALALTKTYIYVAIAALRYVTYCCIPHGLTLVEQLGLTMRRTPYTVNVTIVV